MEGETPFDVYMRRMRYKNEPLQTLLRALKICFGNDHFAAADHVDRAVYALRESELEQIDAFVKSPEFRGGELSK